jgi:hypothetical protein
MVLVKTQKCRKLGLLQKLTKHLYILKSQWTENTNIDVRICVSY